MYSRHSANDDFALAKALFDRLKHSSDTTALSENVYQLVIDPYLSQYSIAQSYKAIERSLSPNVQTRLVDHFAAIFEPLRERLGVQSQSLRDRVFPQPKVYQETGSEGNRILARILNDLERATTPADNLTRAGNVVFLPADAEEERQKAHEQKRMSGLQERKAQLLGQFRAESVRALLGHSYGMMNPATLSNLHWFEQNVEGGQDISKQLTNVVTDLAGIGDMIRHNMTFEEALQVQDRLEPRSAGIEGREKTFG